MTSPDLGLHLFEGSGLEPPAMAERDAHIWSLDLRADSERLAHLATLLSNDEKRRAIRFRFPRHRRRYMVSWGVLRLLLGAYRGTSAAGLEFDYGPKGKPELADGAGPHFNLSHSDELALIAVAGHGPVGVDLERIRTIEDADDIAQRFYSSTEVAAYRGVRPEQRDRAFFNCWTRKEAFVKALGEGLFLSLDRFDVSLVPGEPATLLAVDGDPEQAAEWSLAGLEPAQGFVGALATRWEPERIRCRSLDLARAVPLDESS